MPGGGPYGDLFTHLEVNGFDGMPYAEEGICSICYESYSTLQMACLPDCNHTFCRDCLIGHVRAKMSDLIYPIYCPLCAVDFQVVTKTGASLSFVPAIAWVLIRCLYPQR